MPVLDDDTRETLAARILEQEHLAYPEAVGVVLDGGLDGGRPALCAPMRAVRWTALEA